MSKNQVTVCEQKIICQDNAELAASLYMPSAYLEKQASSKDVTAQSSEAVSSNTSLLKGAVLIGPATGIKRQFYANFANYLAESGYAVLTYDNRGIGESNNQSVNHSDITLQSWGEQDFSAAINHLKNCVPQTKYHLVGHSAGGQLIGLSPESKHLSSVFNFACSSGRLKNMTPANRIKAHFFMNFFIPVSNFLFGHTKSQLVGMGEPLPKHVARQWRHWCNGQGYVKTAFGKSVKQHWYHQLEMPSLWVNAVDDFIAIDANVADMISVFDKLPAQTLTLTPQDHGLKEIGHMKFFSRQSKDLWSMVTDWLAKH